MKMKNYHVSKIAYLKYKWLFWKFFKLAITACIEITNNRQNSY